jgi:uncharacterized membrane protein
MANANDILDKLKNIKSDSESLSSKRTKATAGGAMLGAAGGVLLGLSRNYNLLTSAVVGAIIGGMISHLILPKIEE